MASLWNVLFSWKVKPASREEMQKAACAIVTQSTGREKDLETPGIGNFLLAEATHALWEQCGVPVLPQIEVELAERMRRKESFPSSFTPNQTTDGRSTLSWNTRTVAQLQKEWLCKNGIPLRVVLVASPIHQGRSKWVYERLGFRVFIAEVSRGRYFDGKQDQWWLRNVAGVYLYELCARIFFLAKGWI